MALPTVLKGSNRRGYEVLVDRRRCCALLFPQEAREILDAVSIAVFSIHPAHEAEGRSEVGNPEFGRSVIGGIDADFCNEKPLKQPHFSKSTLEISTIDTLLHRSNVNISA